MVTQAKFQMPEAGSHVWHAESSASVLDSFDSSWDGLSTQVAEARRAQFGGNQLARDRSHAWYQILQLQFVDVLIVILGVAAIISIAVGEYTDAIAIVAIVLLNALLGFIQEWKAERALAALQEMLTPHCTVVRDGQTRSLSAELLVPGDLVVLDAGDQVPADMRILRSTDLHIDESALTGESLPVEKSSNALPSETALSERACMAWMGTNVTHGSASGVVVATGAHSEFGRIAELTASIDRESTPLQRKLAKLGQQLGIAAACIAALVAAAGWWMGNPPLEMFLTSVSLAVAVIPEGLPAVVTLTMALGVRAMVRRKALLRRLRAAESLGAATVVCSDKTGTLTQNAMTVRKIWLPSGIIDVTGTGYDPAGHFEQSGQRLEHDNHPELIALLESALHCNHASLFKDSDGWHESGEPTECALVTAAYKAWLSDRDPECEKAEFAFSSSRKRMTTVEEANDAVIAFSKGAPEVLLPLCSHLQEQTGRIAIDDAQRQELAEAYQQLAAEGLRTLAITKREIGESVPLDAAHVEQDLTLLGFVGLLDPPRPEVPDAIRLARSAGIHVLMITGDSGVTARSIAQQIGLNVKAVVTGQEIDTADDAELQTMLEDDVVFARTTPEHKLRIVGLLQQMGHVVGMTGDGVNDAPALKKADIGVAMGQRGTEVAKGAADIVLTDDNFSSIIGAIEEGRRQYDNIQKFVRYLLSSNVGEVVAIFVNIFLGGPLLFLPAQILWMNLVTDGLTAVALGMEPSEANVMQRPPRKADEPVLDRFGMLTILIMGGWIGVATLILYRFYFDSGDLQTMAIAQTVAFTGIILIEKVNVFNFRSLQGSLRSVALLGNPWVLSAVAVCILMQVVAVYWPPLQELLHTRPLAVVDWLAVAAVALPTLLIGEVMKWLLFRRLRPNAHEAV